MFLFNLLELEDSEALRDGVAKTQKEPGFPESTHGRKLPRITVLDHQMKQKYFYFIKPLTFSHLFVTATRITLI